MVKALEAISTSRKRAEECDKGAWSLRCSFASFSTIITICSAAALVRVLMNTRAHFNVAPSSTMKKKTNSLQPRSSILQETNKNPFQNTTLAFHPNINLPQNLNSTTADTTAALQTDTSVPQEFKSIQTNTTATSYPNTSFPQERLSFLDLRPDTRICRLTGPRPVLNQQIVRKQQNGKLSAMQLEFWYQCAGDGYNNYTTQYMFPFLRRKQSEVPSWGTRPNPIPIQNKSKSILIIGNSHTRQLFSTLMCQYQDQYLSRNGYHRTFRLGSSANLTISALYNHAAVYSPRWKQNLEEILQHPLEKLDVIVIGQFNIYRDEYKDTFLWQKMVQDGINNPHWQINVAAHPSGFGIDQLAQHFMGAVVFVPMFNTARIDHANEILERMHQFIERTNRTNLHSLNTRAHLSEPEIRDKECPSDNNRKVRSCNGKSHRCLGDKGGEVDLVVYELVEKLWDIFS